MSTETAVAETPAVNTDPFGNAVPENTETVVAATDAPKKRGRKKGASENPTVIVPFAITKAEKEMLTKFAAVGQKTVPVALAEVLRWAVLSENAPMAAQIQTNVGVYDANPEQYKVKRSNIRTKNPDEMTPEELQKATAAAQKFLDKQNEAVARAQRILALANANAPATPSTPV